MFIETQISEDEVLEQLREGLREAVQTVVIQGSYMLPEEAAADSGRMHSGGGVIGGDRS